MVRVYVVPYDTRYGVISAASPRVTPGNTFYGQPQAESRAVETYGIDGILRAGRDIPATGRFNRPVFVASLSCVFRERHKVVLLYRDR